MKRFFIRFSVKDKKDFLQVRDGLKTVETRAATPKYRAVAKGDILVIVCGRARLEKKVKRARVFRSIGAMVKAIPRRKIMPSAPTLAAMRQMYYGYPNYREKLKKFGVVAWEI